MNNLYINRVGKIRSRPGTWERQGRPPYKSSFYIKEKIVITVDNSGRVLMEAVSISPTRRKDSALSTWTRVEYAKDQAYAQRELKSGRLPRVV